MLKFGRTAGGYYYVSFRVDVGYDFPISASAINGIQVHFQASCSDNTYIVSQFPTNPTGTCLVIELKGMLNSQDSKSHSKVAPPPIECRKVYKILLYHYD